MKDNFPEIITKEKFNEGNSDFRNALFNLDEKIITADNFYYLTKIYSSAKQLEIRNKILKLLYDLKYDELKDFFSNAYKKERYLDMKIYALRGLSNFISEDEIAKLLFNFNQTLAKRVETTPYNYQEYELLRGKNALPYLIEKYDYSCFKTTLEQVNVQYNKMPEAFKGHFTTDNKGEIVLLRTQEEVKNTMDKFWDEDRKKYEK